MVGILRPKTLLHSAFDARSLGQAPLGFSCASGVATTEWSQLRMAGSATDFNDGFFRI
jgi:hypothetical protein